MPRESDIAIWLHAMRLATVTNPKIWEKAFDAQQAHAREQSYCSWSEVTLYLLDDAARRFMGQTKKVFCPVCGLCTLCNGAGGREVPVSWNMTQGEVYETRWEPCPECGEDHYGKESDS